MTTKSITLRTALAVTIAIFFSNFTDAQESPRQDPASRGRAQRPAQKPIAEEVQKVELAGLSPTIDERLPKIMEDLSEQIGKLALELRLLRRDTERNGTALELMLYEERLSKVESKLDDMNALKNQLEARDQELQRRLRNIQQELILRGGQFLRRDVAEAAIRSDIQAALDDTRTQKETTQQRVTDLQTQAEALRRRVEVLRKKVEQLEAKTEGQNQ